MAATIHNVPQGSSEWHALRARHYCASDAAAMMGEPDAHETRGALLRRLANGEAREHSEATQRAFEAGHAAEAAFRPHAEALAGGELYPAVMTAEIDGLPLLASLDGITLDGATAYEHKLHGETLAQVLRERAEPPMRDVWQIEQQLLVSGADRALYCVSDGTPERAVTCWYESRPERRAALIAGWHQLDRDRRAGVAAAADSAPVGVAPAALPALRIEVRGEVVASNITEWRDHALSTIRAVNRDLVTDEDFAAADAAVKWCGEVEAKLKAAKDHALSQTATIDALFRALDEIAAEARTVRLDLGKLVTQRKDAIRAQVIDAAMSRLKAQATEDGRALGEHAPGLPADARSRIIAAIKGLRTVQTITDAADAERARLATEYTRACLRRAQTVETMRRIGDETGLAHLWRYDAALLDADPASLADVLRGRIAAHEADQRARAAVAPVAAAPVPPAPTTPARLLTLREVCERLAPLKIDAAGLAVLGIQPARGRQYDNFPAICEAIAAHVRAARVRFEEGE